MFAVSPCLEGKKKKKLRGLHFPLRLQEAFLLQNCVLPRRLACQTVLFTQKLSQVCQGTEMPERNQGMPQPQIPAAAGVRTSHHQLCWRRGRGPGLSGGDGTRSWDEGPEGSSEVSLRPTLPQSGRKEACSLCPSFS